MSPQYCKVGRISPSLYIASKLQKLEDEYKRFFDEAYILMHVDQSISDLLYFEASKLKRKIITLRKFI